MLHNFSLGWLYIYIHFSSSFLHPIFYLKKFFFSLFFWFFFLTKNHGGDDIQLLSTCLPLQIWANVSSAQTLLPNVHNHQFHLFLHPSKQNKKNKFHLLYLTVTNFYIFLRCFVGFFSTFLLCFYIILTRKQKIV